MKIGDQLEAPNGFDSLKCGERYSNLGRNTFNQVTLILFTTQKSGRRVHIYRMNGERFEFGVLENLIVVAKNQYSLPPWLATIEGANLDEMDLERTDFVMTHRARTEQRYGYIFDLLARIKEILDASNPFLIINQHARELTPKQNRTRLAEWFFAYICHERKLMSLYPEYPDIGVYDRTDEKYANVIFGRTSLSNGRKHGYSSAQFAEKIPEAYWERSGLGKTMKEIYRDSAKNEWGCQSRMDKNGKYELYHPEGKPFPDTYGKFRYRVLKKYAVREVQTKKYGAARVRSTFAASKGKTTEEISNLLQQFEVDAYYLKERARSRTGEPMPRLCVARGVCVGSKNIVGVGFSLEGEDGEAYRAMLFSCAIPKEIFARLLGIERGILPWLAQGVAPHIISDRGSAPISAIITNLQMQFPVKEMTESYAGQSKPSVEGGHPRDVDTEGPPSYVLSDHNVIQMVQQEICRAALDNHSSSVCEQVLGSRVDANVISPHGLWQELDRIGCNDGIAMSFETAVRTFLTPKTFSLRHDGIWFEDRCFGSDLLDGTGVRERVSPGQEIEVRGYTLSMCILYVWVEVERQLIELRQKHPYRVGTKELLLSIEEIHQEAEKKRALDSAQRTSSDAAHVEARRLFEEATGAKWSSGERLRGTPKKNSRETKAESDILKSTSRKKSA